MPKYKPIKEGVIDNFITRVFTSVGKGLESRALKKISQSDPELAKKFKDLEKTKKLQTGTGEVKLALDKSIILGSGKGKFELYDKAIPSFMKKYDKKWNAQVYDDVIPYNPDDIAPKLADGDDIPVTIIQITDDMKKSVQQDGQALFSIFGIGAGAKIASDSMQNNIISEQTN